MLSQLRNSLKKNAWEIFDGKIPSKFHFKEFLIHVLISNGKRISRIRLDFLRNHESVLKDEYAQILDYINQNIHKGDVIEIIKVIKKRVNGSFSGILNDFVVDYEKNYS